MPPRATLLVSLAILAWPLTVLSQGAEKANSFRLNLQGGFRGDPVRIYLDGKKVFEGTPKTDPRLSLGGQFDATANAERPMLRVELPTRNVDSTSQLDPAAGRNVGISLGSGKIGIRQS